MIPIAFRNAPSPGQKALTILAADIGGTKTNVALYQSGNNGLTLTATIKNAGPKGAGFMYSSGKHRHDALEFTSKRTWTAGVTNALWNLAVA